MRDFQIARRSQSVRFSLVLGRPDTIKRMHNDVPLSKWEENPNDDPRRLGFFRHFHRMKRLMPMSAAVKTAIIVPVQIILIRISFMTKTRFAVRVA